LRGEAGMIHISDLQIKDVVNVHDGKKLGSIEDVDIDLKTGKIQAIMITSQGKVLGFFGKGEEIVIPWRNIVKIGKDVILVRVSKNVETE
jgi:YlmC/YmxH family sporulation protein